MASKTIITMELKDKLVSSFMIFENQVDIDSSVHDIRSEAIKTFEEKGFPSKRMRHGSIPP